VTVREWVESRSTVAPASLTLRMIAALGSGADEDESLTPDVCVRAAARALENLVTDARYGRESALDLLAIDALTTHAFEYASERAPAEIDRVASSCARLLAPLTAERV
jgi:uncharacterized membrane protein